MPSQSPFGFRWVGHRYGAPLNSQINQYFIPSGDTSAYYIGDAVRSAANADTRGVPAIQKATVGTETLRGILVEINVAGQPLGYQGLQLDTTIHSIPATKAKGYYVWVCDDPLAVFEIQDDGITTANLVATNANKNASLTIAVPSSANQRSGTVLLSSSFAVTQGLNIKLLGLSQRARTDGPNAFGAYANWLCMINQHELAGNTVGV